MVCVRSSATSTSMAGEIDAGERREERLDALDDLDDVGARLAADDDQHGALAVGPGRDAVVLDVVVDVRDVAEPHRRAVVWVDDQVAVLVGAEELIVGGDGRRLRARPPMRPLGPVRPWRRPARCRTSSRVRPTPASASGSTCTRTAGCWPPPTKTWPTPSTCEIFCARTVLAASKTCASGSGLRGEREDQDRRVGRVDLAVVRAERQVGRQLAAGGVDGRLHVARRRVDVAVEIELQGDRRRAERARRGHLGRRRRCGRSGARAASPPPRPSSPGWRRGGRR